ncbi:MAG: hypothetical protein RSB88_00265, partial [Akkermansia sp.]
VTMEKVITGENLLLRNIEKGVMDKEVKRSGFVHPLPASQRETPSFFVSAVKKSMPCKTVDLPDPFRPINTHNLLGNSI